jgi:hypothetical protein
MRDPNNPTLRLKSGDRIIGDDGQVTCYALRDIEADEGFDLDAFTWVRQKPTSGGSIDRAWGIRGHAGKIAGVRWMSHAAAIAAGLA